MKLVDLSPAWIDSAGGRKGVMLAFDCPCGKKEPTDYCEDIHRCMIPLRNPLDGGPRFDERPSWERTGEDFATLTLSPSVNRPVSIGGCGWHGWIRNGEVISV